MYISYSGYKSYSSCPKQYWYRYIGKPVLEEPDNRVNSLFGTLIGHVFEVFYNERLWTMVGVEQRLRENLAASFDDILAREAKTGVIKWKAEDKKANYVSPEALRDDILETISRGLRIIKHHRLLGTPAAAEVKLDHKVGLHMLGGRADFIMRRIKPHEDTIIIDGKGSKWRDKYVDDRQLRWYAMLYRLKHQAIPDRLGFVYWRFEPEESLDWVACTPSDLDSLQVEVTEALDKLEAGKATLVSNPDSLPQVFPVKPGDSCRFCAYMPLCAEGQKFDGLMAPKHTGTGVEDVGL
jgi:hypothetical protein